MVRDVQVNPIFAKYQTLELPGTVINEIDRQKKKKEERHHHHTLITHVNRPKSLNHLPIGKTDFSNYDKSMSSI